MKAPYKLKNLSAVLIAALILYSFMLLFRRNSHYGFNRIVLVTIDTLRADHLSTYGYPRETAPFIDHLAEQGFVFKNAYTPISTTSPAHASLFTSLYPLQHRVLNNGQILDKSFTTMAELLSLAGFTTAAFVSTNSHFKVSGLDKGFNTFNEPPVYRNNKYILYRKAENTINKAIKWIDNNKDTDKFFLWIHLFDPHHPYDGYPEQHDVFRNGTNEERDKMAGYLTYSQKISSSAFLYSKDLMLDTIASYDSEIRYADHELYRFFNHYISSVHSEDTIFIITADHGEGLGNHSYLRHAKNIYNEQMKVPLIFYSTAEKKFSGYSKQICCLTDVFPTIMDLLGKDTKKLFAGVKEAQGRSLKNFLENSLCLSLKPRKLIGQRREFDINFIKERGKKAAYEKGTKYMLISGQWKYILRSAYEDEFFNIMNDPYETKNLISKNRSKAEKYRKKLTKELIYINRNRGKSLTSDDRGLAQRLKSLGYLQ